MSTKNASNVANTFGTPQAPRKHNQDQTRSSSKVKSRGLITANDQKLNYDPEHQLADLQVECSNKDRTTQELEKYIEDMKEKEELGDIIKLHDEEKYKLIQHWCSVECQTAIKAYIDGKVHKESAETESVKNTAINEVEQEIINKDPQIDDQCQEVSENCSQKDNKEVLNHTKTGNDSITPITSGVINDLETAGDIDIKEKNERTKEECSNTDAKYNVEQETTNGNGTTESFDSSHKINVEKKIIHNKIVGHVANTEGRNKSINEADKVSITNKRSVIQDIFDDWGVENAEDDSQSVENELKSLLNDTKTRTIEESTVVLVEEEITCIEKEPVVDAEKAIEVAKQNKEMQAVGKSTKDSTHDTAAFSQTSQIIPINRGRNLTSQLSQVELAKA
ncbi:probable inactive protein kinase DDB_G0270444 [Bombus flavifrons]|uniref:probable inactive protein kinase DDB_G0270444 n=1 Tax=Bombus flavifrons TaxID=103934 RepID=UPI0037046D90